MNAISLKLILIVCLLPLFSIGQVLKFNPFRLLAYIIHFPSRYIGTVIKITPFQG